MTLPRDIYPSLAREEVVNWCTKNGWRIVRFGPARVGDRAWLCADHLCVTYIPGLTDFSDNPRNYRLILERAKE